MKLILLLIAQLLIALQLFSQKYFDVEGEQIKIGTISRTYNFAYSLDDTFSLFLADSVIEYVNNIKTIKKTISYSVYDKPTEPSINIKYTTARGQDSLSKHYSGDKLNMIYQTSYDNAGRIVYYGMKDFNSDLQYSRGFEWFYEYRDSSISTGKIEIQTIFVSDANGYKRFHFKVLNVFDIKNRKIREVRDPDNVDADIIEYVYNDYDSLVSKKHNNQDETLEKGKKINTICDIENEYFFNTTDYYSIRKLINQLLINNKISLTNQKCENYFFTLTSKRQKAMLTFIKRKPYWCEGQKIIFTITQQL